MADWSTGGHLRRGLVILGLGLGGFAAWATLTGLEGAVVAPGAVAVEARRQAVQHPEGGVVAALHVGEGDAVAAGAPLLALDGTEHLAERALALRERVETLARLDRLAAETRGAARITWRAELTELQGAVSGLDGVLRDETALFAARRATLAQTLAQLGERQVQTEAIITGRARQLAAAEEQHALIADELATQEALFARGLTEAPRLSALRREAARLGGEIGALEAGIAEARSAIAGYEVERLRLEAGFREAAQAELRRLQPRAAELRERLSVVERRIDRLVLRAPMAGRVLGLQVHTIGGVVAAGAEIAAIVPADDPLILAVEIEPGQVDQVRPGQAATIRFPNFHAATTPEATGRVRQVSADAMADPATGRRFFRAELTFDPAAEPLGGQPLRPGMPVEAFIRTDARTPASFLIKPIADYWAYAMREE